MGSACGSSAHAETPENWDFIGGNVVDLSKLPRLRNGESKYIVLGISIHDAISSHDHHWPFGFDFHSCDEQNFRIRGKSSSKHKWNGNDMTVYDEKYRLSQTPAGK